MAGPSERTHGPIADPDGFVPFDRFIDWALYDPQAGFYARPGPRIGPTGDFYTATHASPLYPRTLGRHIGRILAGLAVDGRPLRMVEIGPGDGRLAEGMVSEIAAALPGTARWSYHLVERSSARLAETMDRLARAAGTAAGPPIRALPSIGEGGPFRGVVLAQEVLDAIPPRRFRRDRSGWRELGVRRTPQGRWEEADRPAMGIPPALGSAGHRIEEGSIAEVAMGAAGLVRAILDHLVEGRLIVIDFGMDAREIASAHPRGTLQAIAGHRWVDPDPNHEGRADWSTFVDLDLLRAEVRAAGGRILFDEPFREALVRWGLPEVAAEAEEALARDPAAGVRLRLGVKNLLFGFDRFRVFEIAPGDPSAPERPAA
ncbi:MAG: SAM-dependent methyltransferase [Thermoplasmata archaeon]